MKYPRVMDEWDTMAAAVSGQSLARYGDGELRVCVGRNAITQAYHPRLAEELRHILKNNHSAAMPCIPHMRGPNTERFWHKYDTKQFRDLYDPTRTYGSAFITRPDNAPGIEHPNYWRLVRTLWKGLPIVLVHSGVKSFDGLLKDAGHVREVIGPPAQAWAQVDRIEEEIGLPAARVLIALGATSGALVERLARKHVHAVDVGHLGMFMRRSIEQGIAS